MLPAAIGIGTVIALTAFGGASAAFAAPGDDDFLGTAGSFSVLAASEVTNTGPSVLDGGNGVHPGTAITGFPPGIVGGATHAGDAVALQAQADVGVAVGAVLAIPSYDVGIADLVGTTFLAGAYSAASSMEFSGTITLKGDADDVFIFTSGSTLTTGSASRVALIGGALACNVYWRVGSSATLGTGSTFVGTLMASTAVTATTGTTIAGRLFAQTAAVTLDTNVFTTPACDRTAGDGDNGLPTGAGDDVTPAPTETTPEDTAAGLPPLPDDGGDGTGAGDGGDGTGAGDPGPAGLAVSGWSGSLALMIAASSLALGWVLLAVRRRRTVAVVRPTD
jgi:hypothetical protein